MRWALPFIAAAITFGLGLVGAPHASGYGAVPVAALRLAAMPTAPRACGMDRSPASALGAMRQAATKARWEPGLLWAGLLLGTPDMPLAAAWRGLVDYSRRREAPVASRPC